MATIGNIQKYIRDAGKAGIPLDELKEYIRDMDEFRDVYMSILEITRTFGEVVGKLSKKQGVAQEVPPEEAEWQRFFRDNSFGNPGNEKMILSLVEILTGMSLAKYAFQAKKAPTYVGGFPSGVVIVPLDGDNGHDYDYGEPILAHHGKVCIRMNGSTGNNMTTSTSCYDIASPEQIEYLLLELCFHKAAWERTVAIAGTSEQETTATEEYTDEGMDEDMDNEEEEIT